jgi:gluconate 5-dehydrogenase
MPTVSELFSLKGKVAFVTGGAGHLGFPMSEALSEAGAHVVIASRDDDKCRAAAEKLSAAGPRAIGLKLDAAAEPSIAAAVEAALRQFGRIDVLINNAYSAAYHRSPEDMPLDVFESALRGNITAYYAMIKACLPHLRRNGAGSIINIASMYGMVSPHFDIYRDSKVYSPVHYHATKGAVLQVTRYFAGYLARENVRVNAISPGAFPNPGIQAAEPAFVEELRKQAPMDRVGRPHELKGAVLFLASEASSFVTGHNLVVDGGWTIW